MSSNLEREIELSLPLLAFQSTLVRIVQCLRKFNKEVRNPRWRTFTKGAWIPASAIQIRRSRPIQASRSTKDVAQLECLETAFAASMRERRQVHEKEQKSLESSI
jgi:hypothetical protein